MAQIYASLIMKEAINPKTGEAYKITDVPELIRIEVMRILNGGEYEDPDVVQL